MTNIQAIESVSPETAARLLALNNRFAQETSWLSDSEWSGLVAGAAIGVAIGADAFLLAFDQDASYESRNLQWFKSRFDRFIYIDRVVVDSAAQGRGLGRRLYDALAIEARRMGHERIVCEVNTVPDNSASHSFHERLGFKAVADMTWETGTKAVRFYEWTL